MRAISTAALLLALLSHTCAWAQTYRWVDPQSGRTVISDTPPPANAQALRQQRGDSSSSTNSRQDSYAMQQASRQFPVTLYTAPACQRECQQARALLKQRGVPYSEKELKSNDDIVALKQLLGSPEAFVPSLQVGKQTARGLEEGAWQQLLDNAGYPGGTVGH